MLDDPGGYDQSPVDKKKHDLKEFLGSIPTILKKHPSSNKKVTSRNPKKPVLNEKRQQNPVDFVHWGLSDNLSKIIRLVPYNLY